MALSASIVLFSVFTYAGLVQADYVIPANTVVFDTTDGIHVPGMTYFANEWSTFNVDQRIEQTYIPPSGGQVICAVRIEGSSSSSTPPAFEFGMKWSQGALSANSQNRASIDDFPLYPSTSTFTFYWDPCVVLTGSVASTLLSYRTSPDVSGGSGLAIYATVATSTATSTLYAPVLTTRDLDGGEVATSSWPLLMTFYGSGAVSYFEQPSADAYGFGTGAASGTDFGLFGNMIRDMFLWLFVPPATVQDGIGAYIDDVKLRVPFGYFAQVSSTLTGLGEETTTSSQIILYASSTTSTLSAVVFDPTQLGTVIPSGVQSLVRFFGGLAMWAMLFLFIFRKATGAGEIDTDEV